MNDLVYIEFNDNNFWFTKQEILLSFLLIIVIIAFIIYVVTNNKKKEKYIKNGNHMKNINRKRKDLFSINDYSYFIIKVLGISEKDFFDTNLDIQYDIYSQTLYYIYHIFICEQLLSKKYGSNTANKIGKNTVDLLLEYQSKGQDNKLKFNNTMFIYYANLHTEVKNIFENNEDFTKSGFYKLSKQFLKDIKFTDSDITSITDISICFMSFIRFHSENILNENIELTLA